MEELAFICTYSRSYWESLTPEQQDLIIKDFVLSIVSDHESVAYVDESTLKWEERYEATIDGLRLFPEDEEGNPIPEMVAIRASVQAAPSQWELDRRKEDANGRS